MRRSAIFILCLALASCGGSSSSVVSCDQQYWDGTVGTCLPEQWHVVSAEDLQTRGSPREVVIAFQSDTPISGRFPLVTVTAQSLAGEADVTEFDEQSRQAVKTLPGYSLVDEKAQTIDEQSTTLHIFTAQPIAEQPVQRFYQVSYPSGGKGYTFTGVLPLSVAKDEETRLMTLLTNITFTERKEEE